MLFFAKKKNFGAIYMLLCGEKLRKKLAIWSKNDKYQLLCRLPFSQEGRCCIAKELQALKVPPKRCNKCALSKTSKLGSHVCISRQCLIKLPIQDLIHMYIIFTQKVYRPYSLIFIGPGIPGVELSSER